MRGMMWMLACLSLIATACGCADQRSAGARSDLVGYRTVVVLPVADRALAAALGRTLANAGFQRIAASAEALRADPTVAAATLVCEARADVGPSMMRIRLHLSDYASGATRYARVLPALGPAGYADALSTIAPDLAR